MLERLFLSDLVLADMTCPTAMSITRSASGTPREIGCVLLAADWSRQLFDVAQMRTVRYPCRGAITADTAAAVQAAIRPGIENLARGISPMHQTLPGFPDKVDPSRARSIRKQLDDLSRSRRACVRCAPRRRAGGCRRRGN